MQAITGISDAYSQVINLAIPDGSSATITLSYRPQQDGWYFDLSWNGSTPAYVVNGLRVTTFPNMLRQFSYALPFGLACVTSDNLEPLNLEDFASGYAQLILLGADDVAQVEATVFPGD